MKTNHGRYDFFERGAMVKEFEDARFSGQIGDLVGPVQTQFGQHLIKIEDRRDNEEGTGKSKPYSAKNISWTSTPPEQTRNPTPPFSQKMRRPKDLTKWLNRKTRT